MQFGKTCTRKFWKDAQIALVLWTRAILNVLQKLTRACFSQIALETILLPMLMTNTLTNIDVVIFLSASFFGRSYHSRYQNFEFTDPKLCKALKKLPKQTREFAPVTSQPPCFWEHSAAESTISRYIVQLSGRYLTKKLHQKNTALPRHPAG